jgi:hypothetical protein
MAKTGPQRYPGASTAYWFQDTYSGDAMESNVIVWHSTEGRTLPSYDGGALAPNFTAVPDFAARRMVWYQHFDFDTSSRALRNLAGGVQTNTLNVTQVEIVGTCDPTTHTKWGSTPHLYTPELPTWAIRDLAAFARWAHDQHGVPLSSGLEFRAYPSSYGNSSVRMTSSQWNAFSGHCGHQHVPENDHGDPGAIDFNRLLALAKGTTEEDDDVTPEDILKIASASAAATATKLIAGGGVLENSDISRIAAAVAAKPVTLTDAQIQAIAASPVLAENIAARVDAKLAARLAN